MITDLRWLGLEVKDLDAAREFYVTHLDLGVHWERENEVALHLDRAGTGGNLVLRRPESVPRGGLHTHYALSVPAGEYDEWYDRLAGPFDLVEHSFGSVTSLYFYDLDGNCVELAGTDVEGPGVDGAFEVVLEVADLARAVDLYAALGFEEVDREDDRVRLSGPVDLELWTPRLGIADARGGVHVDLGFGVTDREAVADAVEGRVRSVERRDGELRVRDHDGHSIAFR